MTSTSPTAEAQPRGVGGYIFLPKQITGFERDYVNKINRVAMGFFLVHLPVFMLVAWLCETGVVKAFALTSLALVGPVLAWKMLKNPRHVAIVFGFTSMCLGGLLVHFGQGPMQIEMHFYFFVLLALMSVYGNPLVIIVAAATVSLHHLIVYAVLPSSVFNYDASIWVVLVHALFVVLESIASVFLARSFFDDVIGLEQIVQKRTAELDARNRDMRLVLDNVNQGFVTIDMDGVLSSEYSAVLSTWFGPIEQGATFGTLLSRIDENIGDWLELSLEDFQDGFAPVDLLLDQMPHQIKIDDKTLHMNFTPLTGSSGEIEQFLVVVSDITASLEHKRMESERGEILQVFERIVQDKAGFIEFFAEAESQILSIVEIDAETSIDELRRDIHTLKGNSGIFGLQSIAVLCHQLETHIEETGDGLNPSDVAELKRRWSTLCANLSILLDTGSDDRIELEDSEYEQILRDVLGRVDHDKIAARIKAWKLEPTERRLQRLGMRAKALARRLNKGEIEIEIEDHALRTNPKRWQRFWGSSIHVLRNAIDHGLEFPHERLDTDKSHQSRVSLKTFIDEEQFVIEIADDGRGIDWEKVAQTAKERGLPNTSENDLRSALFIDGFTTCSETSLLSGRGVGMSAIQQACSELDGTINIISNMGQGTRVQFRFPQNQML